MRTCAVPVLDPVPLEEDEAEAAHAPAEDRDVLLVGLENDLEGPVPTERPHQLEDEPPVAVHLFFYIRMHIVSFVFEAKKMPARG